MIWVLTFLFLMGAFTSSTLYYSLYRTPTKNLWREIHDWGWGFWYFPIHKTFFKKSPLASLLFACRFVEVFSLLSAFGFLIGGATPLLQRTEAAVFFLNSPQGFFLFLLFLTLFAGIVEYLPHFLVSRSHRFLPKAFPFFTSFFLLLLLPLTLIFGLLSRYLFPPDFFSDLTPLGQANEEIFTIIQSANTSPYFDANDKKLISQVIRFRDRIAKEIMVPRVDIFSLPATMTIKEAGKVLYEEGYSRIPIYRDNVDDIIGVLMYKDLLHKYLEFEKGEAPTILDATIETIIKGVLFTPETKKISLLLHEFRRKQTHIAIVIDEYGGTEGLITIEDILEEIVGEIEDEYDVDESLFLALPQGGWLVDGRMSILDIQEQLHIKIPQEGDYDTIGGFVFYRAGVIPSKGFFLDEQGFTIQILRSNDRRVEKIRLEKKNTLPEENSSLNGDEA